MATDRGARARRVDHDDVGLELVACPEPGCGVPAEVVDSWTFDSTDGPLPFLLVRCARRHVLTVEDRR